MAVRGKPRGVDQATTQRALVDGSCGSVLTWARPSWSASSGGGCSSRPGLTRRSAT